jgi:hypothetical protein
MEEKDQKKKWEAPKVQYVGQVSEVLKGGGGKLSNAPADPGEPLKTPPSL